MNFTAWIDVAIGLTLVYLGTSLFVTVINEFIAQLFNLRGKHLCNSLKTLIADENIRDVLKKNPALKTFFENNPKNPPAYIDTNLLSRLMLGSLTSGSKVSDTVDELVDEINSWNDSELKSQLLALAHTAGTKTDNLVNAVSDWADRTLTMLGGNYKRNLQTISFWIGLLVVIILNLDSVALTERLYQDKEARNAAVELGLQITKTTNKAAFDHCMAKSSQERKNDSACIPLMGLVDVVQGRNKSLGQLPIGWTNMSQSSTSPFGFISPDAWSWASRLAGWLLTAFAVSLGAPFWFDLLNKFINIRYGSRKPRVEQKST